MQSEKRPKPIDEDVAELLEQELLEGTSELDPLGILAEAERLEEDAPPAPVPEWARGHFHPGQSCSLFGCSLSVVEVAEEGLLLRFEGYTGAELKRRRRHEQQSTRNLSRGARSALAKLERTVSEAGEALAAARGGEEE